MYIIVLVGLICVPVCSSVRPSTFTASARGPWWCHLVNAVKTHYQPKQQPFYAECVFCAVCTSARSRSRIPRHRMFIDSEGADLPFDTESRQGLGEVATAQSTTNNRLGLFSQCCYVYFHVIYIIGNLPAGHTQHLPFVKVSSKI